MDYDSGPCNITIPAGKTNATVNITINDDNELEPNENFTATITPKSQSTIVTAGKATVTIVDNDREL